ncbi:MAG: 4Fe-4S dicluster domain-containing protein [Halanaerobium sp.]
MKVVFVDVERCVGCRHCEMACAVEHSSAKDLYSMLNEEPQAQPRIKVGIGIDLMTFPNKCQHCDPAPCEEACPTNVIYHDQELNSVQVKEEKCISCGMCAMVCPNDAIDFRKIEKTGNDVIYKCDHCIERQRTGEIPACVEACTTDAMIFAEANEVSKMRQTKLFQNITSQIRGQRSKHKIPANIKAYKEFQEKLASFGPFPASVDKEAKE